jgi:hypothetical protein
LPRAEIVHSRKFPDRVSDKSALGDEAVMIRCLIEDVSHIYLAAGVTDFENRYLG